MQVGRRPRGRDAAGLLVVTDAADELIRMAEKIETEGRHYVAIAKSDWPNGMDEIAVAEGRAVYRGRAFQCETIARSLRNRAGRLRNGTAGR